MQANIHQSLVWEYTRKEGIQILLKGSGLNAEFNADGHLIISSDDVYGDSMMNSKKNVLAAVISFFAVGSGAQGVFAQEDESKGEMGWALEEVSGYCGRGVRLRMQDTCRLVLRRLGGSGWSSRVWKMPMTWRWLLRA